MANKNHPDYDDYMKMDEEFQKIWGSPEEDTDWLTTVNVVIVLGILLAVVIFLLSEHANV